MWGAHHSPRRSNGPPSGAGVAGEDALPLVLLPGLPLSLTSSFTPQDFSCLPRSTTLGVSFLGARPKRPTHSVNPTVPHTGPWTVRSDCTFSGAWPCLSPRCEGSEAPPSSPSHSASGQTCSPIRSPSPLTARPPTPTSPRGSGPSFPTRQALGLELDRRVGCCPRMKPPGVAPCERWARRPAKGRAARRSLGV